MTNGLAKVKTEYLILAPMIPMVVHIFTFFDRYDHWLIAGMVAATFDMTLFLLFKYLRTREIRRDKTAYRSLWVAISIMAGFQLYVNIRVYWSVHAGPDAVMMGSIFPLMFGFLSFLSARLEHKVESYRQTIQTASNSNNENMAQPNESNREICESIFPHHDNKTRAVNAAYDAGVPKSSAYRYYREFEKEGSLI